MAEIYNEKITRNTDWGGDASTGGKPVSGRRVQEFIKEELSSKVGAIYKPEGGTIVYCFADEADKNAFIESGNESLVLDSFETISKYKVRINSETLQRSHSVIYGTTGNVIEFQFQIVDDSEMITDSRASIEYSFLASGIINKYTTEIQMNADGWTSVRSDVIDRFLRKGENTITITVAGLSSRASSQFIVTFNLFDLAFTTNFEYSQVQNGNTISVPYSVSCTETKYLEFYLDGVLVHSSESEVIADAIKSSTATLNITGFEPGVHSMQARAYVKANDGTRFYAPTHYYTFAVGGEADPSFLMRIELDNRQEVALDGNALTLNISQFEQVSFNWGMYDRLERKLVVWFDLDETNLAKATADRNGEIYSFSFRPMDFGEGKELKMYAHDDEDNLIFEHTINLNVTETSSGIKETTDGLLLKLQAQGRRNSDADKDIWSCLGSDRNVYNATFNNFAWNAQQGWNEETESLVISNGATVDFNIQPMKNRWDRYGGTIEMDIETFDIEDDDAVICECKNDIEGVNNAYFRVTATKAEFSTADGVKIFTRYKDNDRLKMVFIGNSVGDSEDGNMIYIVINGVLERAAIYDGNSDRIQSDAFLRIGDPTGKCKVRLRSIRVYNKAISVDEAFNNYVVDSDDVQNIYEKNNIFKAGTTEVGWEEVANKLPVMIFTGDMNEIVTRGQATKTEGVWYPFDVEYINRQEPERNFVAFNAGMKLQGTSSLGYPRKNFKLKTKNKLFTEEFYTSINNRYEIDPDSPVGNKRLRVKGTTTDLDVDTTMTANGGAFNTMMFGVREDDTTQYKPLKKGKYRFRANSVKANKWTLKADFMESSGSHNVGAGRSWNDIFENTKLSTDGYSNLTYKDTALANGGRGYEDYERDGITYHIDINSQEMQNQKDYVCRTEAQKICHNTVGAADIRTAVDGFPIVCFYRTSHQSDELIFMGQYNFINDKGSYEVFGFEDIKDPATDNDEDESAEVMVYDAGQVECWEGLKNANPISLFHRIDTWEDPIIGWSSTFGSRYPDEDDYGVDGERWRDASVGSPIYELCKWLCSTRHDSFIKPDGSIMSVEEQANCGIYDLSGNSIANGTQTIDIDATFARRINDYQYGYTDATKNNFVYESATGVEDNAINRQKKFETEKWEHFDVWKLAGYYIYLMRYGAVDQFVKNTMLFTDGNGKYDTRRDNKYRKWFYINYDNDCLFGLRNNGELAFDWKLDRQTTDGAVDIIDTGDDEQGVNAYAMMGHESTLWNNLEADDEFMRMVRDLDNSMSRYGLNYDNMVTEFDTKQTEMWCERIYNANERYKYIYAAKGIGDMEGTTVDNLWMLQGTRRSHRHWWIANHFDLLDAKWLSGDYKEKYMQLKITTPPDGTIVPFTAVAGEDYYYAWGTQKKIYESNIVKSKGETMTFNAKDEVQGDPIYVYAVNKMSELDCSSLAPYVFGGSFIFNIGNTEVANTLKKFVIGNPDVVNKDTGVTTSTWTELRNLEYLDITNFEGIKSVPLTSFANLKTFKARGSSLANFSPSEGSSFDYVELPTSISTINMNDILFNNLNSDFNYTPTTSLASLTLGKNDGLGVIYYNKIIKPWIQAIEASTQSVQLYRQAYMDISDINWRFSNLEDIFIFKNFAKYANADSSNKKFNMRGRIDLSSCGSLKSEDVARIIEIFGENCFNEAMSSIYIVTPDSIFISASTTTIVAGESATFRRQIFPAENAVADKVQEIKYFIVQETEEEDDVIIDPNSGKNFIPVDDITTLRPGITLSNRIEDGKQIAVLSSDEIKTGGDTTLTVLVKMDLTTSTTFDRVSFLDFTIKDPTYANNISIIGSSSLYQNNDYVYTISAATIDNEAPLGTHTTEWTITGDGLSYITSSITSQDSVTLSVIGQPEVSADLTLTATYTNHTGGTPLVTSYEFLVLNENVIMTEVSNPVAMSICYNNGWTDGNSSAMLKSQAESVHSLENAFKNINTQFSFDEFAYFTGLTEVPSSAFANSNITSIALPSTIQTIGDAAFYNCQNLTSVSIAVDNEGVGRSYEKTLPEGIETIPYYCFDKCKKLSQLRLPASIEHINDYAFGETNFKHLLLSGETMGNNCLLLSSNIIGIDSNAFESEKWAADTTTSKLETVSIPYGLSIKPEILLSKNLTNIIVEEGHGSFEVVDGVLYSKNMDTLVRYPSKKEYTEEYEIYPSVQTITKYAFVFVQNLDNVIVNCAAARGLGMGIFEKSSVKDVDMHLLASQEEIPKDMFKDCSGLTNVILPYQVLQIIGSNAFMNCTALEEIELPASLTTINGSAFNNCGIISLEFPDNITEIGTGAVKNCDNLEHIKLPKYFSKMEDSSQIITECRNLTSVMLSIFTYTDIESGNNVIVNADCSPILITSCYNLRYYHIPEEDNGKLMIEIDGSLYMVNEDGEAGILRRIPYAISYIEMENTATAIDINALNNCSNLSGITLSENIIDIGLFVGTNIRSITIPSGVTSIDSRCFMGCSNLTTIKVMGHIESIPANTFDGDANLEEAYFYGGVDSIGAFAFRGCSKLNVLAILSEKAPELGGFNMSNHNADNVPIGHPFGHNSASASYAGQSNTVNHLLLPHGYCAEETYELYDNNGALAATYHDLSEVMAEQQVNGGRIRRTSYVGSKLVYSFSDGNMTISLWENPLLNPSMGKFRIEEFTLSGSVVLTVYQNGALLTEGLIYAKTDDGNYSYDENVASAEYSAVRGGFVFDLYNNISHNEELVIYRDIECQYEIGRVTLLFGQTEYEVGSSILQSAAPKRLFSTGIFGSSEPSPVIENTEDKKVELTQSEYDSLMSKINRLTTYLNHLG